VLDAGPKNAQYYGLAPFFTLELYNGLLEARRWSDGKRVGRSASSLRAMPPRTMASWPIPRT
jgi:hypothetical protein